MFVFVLVSFSRVLNASAVYWVYLPHFFVPRPSSFQIDLGCPPCTSRSPLVASLLFSAPPYVFLLFFFFFPCYCPRSRRVPQALTLVLFLWFATLTVHLPRPRVFVGLFLLEPFILFLSFPPPFFVSQDDQVFLFVCCGLTSFNSRPGFGGSGLYFPPLIGRPIFPVG